MLPLALVVVEVAVLEDASQDVLLLAQEVVLERVLILVQEVAPEDA